VDARPIVPCLWLDDDAEAAAAFYTATFPDGRITAVSYYPESFDAPGGQPRGSVLTVEFEVAGQRFTALNGGPMFTLNPSISFFVFVDSPDEADRLFAALLEGGTALMPIDTYPWSERYGWVKDRFGVSWQVLAGPRQPGGAMLVPVGLGDIDYKTIFASAGLAGLKKKRKIAIAASPIQMIAAIVRCRVLSIAIGM